MSAQDFIVPAYRFAAEGATAILVSVLEKESEIIQITKTQSKSQYFYLSESGILLLKTISLI